MSNQGVGSKLKVIEEENKQVLEIGRIIVTKKEIK